MYLALRFWNCSNCLLGVVGLAPFPPEHPLEVRHDPSASPARRRRLSAHGDPPLRGPGSVDSGAPAGDGAGQADSARRAEGRGPGQSVHRGDLSNRNGLHHSSAPEASRRHGEGSGRRGAAGAHRPSSRTENPSSGASIDRAESGPEDGRESRGPDPIPARSLRAVRQAQQEDSRRKFLLRFRVSRTRRDSPIPSPLTSR